MTREPETCLWCGRGVEAHPGQVPGFDCCAMCAPNAGILIVLRDIAKSLRKLADR